MVSPPMYRLSDPLVPIAALKKAPNDCDDNGRVAAEGSGLFRAGADRLVASPTAEPAGRRLVPLSQNKSGPLATPIELLVVVADTVATAVLVGNGVVPIVSDPEKVAETDNDAEGHSASGNEALKFVTTRTRLLVESLTKTNSPAKTFSPEKVALVAALPSPE